MSYEFMQNMHERNAFYEKTSNYTHSQTLQIFGLHTHTHTHTHTRTYTHTHTHTYTHTHTHTHTYTHVHTHTHTYRAYSRIAILQRTSKS